MEYRQVDDIAIVIVLFTNNLNRYQYTAFKLIILKKSTNIQVADSSTLRLMGGIYLFNIRDSEITVTELNAIAKPANSGLKIMPKKGYSKPAAIGINIILYANAQNMFSLIRVIAFFEN